MDVYRHSVSFYFNHRNLIILSAKKLTGIYFFVSILIIKRIALIFFTDFKFLVSLGIGNWELGISYHAHHKTTY